MGIEFLFLIDFIILFFQPHRWKFFVNIGYADSLGSGVRNLYKYTKIYSNAEPNFEENDVFRLSVPMRPAIEKAMRLQKSQKRLQMLQKKRLLNY